MWYQYLRTSVESLTTLYFEANNILEDSKIWFSGGLFNIGGVRKFYQFQSRLMQNGFSTLFGVSCANIYQMKRVSDSMQAKLQEIYLKLSFAMANTVAPNVRLPDIVGTITRAHSSPHATKSMQEVSHIGQFVSNNSKSARFHENAIIRYAQAATELDVGFLEHIRDEVGKGMDAFEMIAALDEPTASKQIKLASFLLTVMERIAARLEAYYASLSQESIYRPEIENNPARTRWNNVRRKIVDGSFFVLASPPSMSASDGVSGPRSRPGHNGVEVDFAQIFASAQQTLQHSPHIRPTPSPSSQQPRRLADMHTARAANNTQAPSTFDLHQQGNAINRMSAFITDNMSTIRRLSRLPAEYDFASLMATYGKHPKQPVAVPSIRSHAQSPGTGSSTSSQGLRVRGPTGNTSNRAVSPLPALAPLRVRSRTPSLERNAQLHYRQPGNHTIRNDNLPPVPSFTASPVSAGAAMSAAVAQLNKRQPPRSTTPLPASPRASLALSTASSRWKLTSEGPLPPVPNVSSTMSALKMAAGVDGDELKFQRLQSRLQ